MVDGVHVSPHLLAPFRLAEIHRAIGFFQHPARVGMRSQRDNASGSTRGDGVASEYKAEAVDVLFQHRCLGLRIGLGEIPQQERKLITAQPSDHIGGADLTSEYGHNGLEDLVARRVPESIVDRLETIDVEHDQRATAVIALDVGDRAAELTLKATPVRNFQQEIGISRGLQLFDAGYRLRQLCPEPADLRFAVTGCLRRRPGHRRGRGPLRRRFAIYRAALATFRCARCRRPGFLLHESLWGLIRLRIKPFAYLFCWRMNISESWRPRFALTRPLGLGSCSKKACRSLPRQDSPFRAPCHALPKPGPIL